MRDQRSLNPQKLSFIDEIRERAMRAPQQEGAPSAFFPELSREQREALRRWLIVHYPLQRGTLQWSERDFIVNAAQGEIVDRILKEIQD